MKWEWPPSLPKKNLDIVTIYIRHRFIYLLISIALSYFWLGNTALPKLLKVTPAVYPNLNDFTGNYIFAIKVGALNSEYGNQAKNIPVGLPSSQVKIWGKLVQKFLIYDRKNKQTDRQK